MFDQRLQPTAGVGNVPRVDRRRLAFDVLEAAHVDEGVWLPSRFVSDSQPLRGLAWGRVVVDPPHRDAFRFRPIERGEGGVMNGQVVGAARD